MFIEFEGAEGAYKTSIIEKLSKALSEVGVQTKCVGQPGGTLSANAFRNMMKYGVKGGEELEAESLLYLALASRVQLMKNVVQPALNDGYVVLSDRGNLSSISLQGYAGGVSLELIESIIQLSENIIKSDVLFYIDIDIETSLSRQSARGTSDILEEKGRVFQEKTINGMRNYPHNQKITNKRINVSGFNPDGSERTSSELAQIILEKIKQEI